MPIRFDNTYAALPEHFHAAVRPEPSKSPATVHVNEELAETLGIDPAWLRSDDGAAFVVGNHVPEGAEPLALVYAGHQFGNWVPRLGDGRAILIGEALTEDGGRLDLQWKGSGRTPYSRGGDGRAPLGPILREALVSEAMHRLGVPTSRVLAAATTGDMVRREIPFPGAVLIRTAASHIRIGTFEYFASRKDHEALARLTDYTLQRHYPGFEDLRDRVGADPAIALLQSVAASIADLIAQWQLLGFIHGVMNTDNMLLSGETIDYGPCAFMNEYDIETVFSSIDRQGRYAYGNQPAIGQWNLARLAQALYSGIQAAGGEEAGDAFLKDAQPVIDAFPDQFRAAFLRGFGPKLGISNPDDDDRDLLFDLLEVMAETNTDFTLTFRALTRELADADAPLLPDSFTLPDAFQPWITRWTERLNREDASLETIQEQMACTNPVYIPRNHLVEEVLRKALNQRDLEPFHDLYDLLQDPYTYRPDHERYALPPEPEERVHATFCGT